MIHMRSFTLKVEIVNTNVAFVEGIKNSFAWTELVKTFISISQQSRFRYKTKQLLKAGKPVKLSFEVRCFENGGNDKGTLIGPKRFCLLGTVDEDWPEEASDILFSDEPIVHLPSARQSYLAILTDDMPLPLLPSFVLLFQLDPHKTKFLSEYLIR